MAEVKENTKSGITELEKIFQEYKTRLEHAEQESSEIVSLAWKKAERIIAEAQEKAQRTAAEIDQKAKKEAEEIVWEAKSKAEKIVKQAEDAIKKEARERTKREAEKMLASTKQEAEKQSSEIIAHARIEADQIVNEVQASVKAETMAKSAGIISEAEESAKKITAVAVARVAETNKLLAEVLQKAGDIFDASEKQIQRELSECLLSLNKAKDGLEVKSITDEANVSAMPEAVVSGPIGGRKELKLIPPYDVMQIKKLSEYLKQLPSLRLAGEVGSESDYSIYLDIFEPLPLLTMLRETSLIASSDVNGDVIELRLKPSRNGS